MIFLICFMVLYLILFFKDLLCLKQFLDYFLYKSFFYFFIYIYIFFFYLNEHQNGKKISLFLYFTSSIWYSHMDNTDKNANNFQTNSNPFWLNITNFSISKMVFKYRSTLISKCIWWIWQKKLFYNVMSWAVY